MTKEEIKRLRRIQEVRDIIDYQTEIHNPCNFDDGEEYAEFCIDTGISFFYGDEGYERTDDTFNDETEDYLRDYITDMMYTEYFDELVALWDENNDEC